MDAEVPYFESPEQTLDIGNSRGFHDLFLMEHAGLGMPAPTRTDVMTEYLHETTSRHAGHKNMTAMLPGHEENQGRKE